LLHPPVVVKRRIGFPLLKVEGSGRLWIGLPKQGGEGLPGIGRSFAFLLQPLFGDLDGGLGWWELAFAFPAFLPLLQLFPSGGAFLDQLRFLHCGIIHFPGRSSQAIQEDPPGVDLSLLALFAFGPLFTALMATGTNF
jgi:hypothetical protein